MDADSGDIVAFDLADKDVDDAAHVSVLLDQISTPIASFMGDGALDTGAVYAAVISRNPDARVIVPPSKDAAPSTNAAAPTRRDKHLMQIKAHGGLMAAWLLFSEESATRSINQRWRHVLPRSCMPTCHLQSY